MTRTLAPFLVAALLSTASFLPAPALACGGYGAISVPTPRELVARSALAFLDQVQPESAGASRSIEALGIEGERASVRIRTADRVHTLSLVLEEGSWIVRTWRARLELAATATAPRS